MQYEQVFVEAILIADLDDYQKQKWLQMVKHCKVDELRGLIINALKSDIEQAEELNKTILKFVQNITVTSNLTSVL